MSTLVTSLDALDDCADTWRALESGASLPTQTWAWARASAATFHAQRGPRVVTVDGGAAPLALRGGRLELLGAYELSEPSDLLARDATARAALAQAVVKLGRPLRLARLPAASPTVAALVAACRGRASVSVRPQAGSPFVRLEPRWREPLACLSSRRRADLKRAVKRAEAKGPLRHEIHAPSPAQAPALLERAWEVEDRSWRAARDGTLRRDRLRGPFFRDWALRAAEDGTLRLAFLHVGDDLVAMQLATVVARGYWLLKVGYDEAWSRCSPGILLMAETIRHAAEQGLERYELMGVVETWTHVWTEDVREAVTLRTYPWRPRGAAAFLADAARAARARIARRAS